MAPTTASQQRVLSKPPTLLTIPYEIRHLIYLDLFSGAKALIMRVHNRCDIVNPLIDKCYIRGVHPQLLRVCNQMRGEALPFFSRHHTALLTPECRISSLPQLLVTKFLKNLTVRLRIQINQDPTAASFFFRPGKATYSQRQKAMELPELQTLAFITEETFPQLQCLEIKAYTTNEEDHNLYMDAVVTRAFIVQEQHQSLQHLIMDTRRESHEQKLKLVRSQPELKEGEIALDSEKNSFMKRVSW